MRALVRSLLVADVEYLDEEYQIPEDRWFGSGATTSTPASPFAEIKMSGWLPGIGPLRRRRLEVWVHDQPGDYDRVDKILEYVRQVLDGAEHRKGASGAEIVRCEWKSDSPDLDDDGYGTITRMSAFEIIGKEPPL